MDAEELPPGWTWATLDNFVRDRGVSVDPARWPEKRFTLYSVPAHALGKPEILYGKDIGSTKQAIVPGTVLLSKINPRINRVWITADHGPNASLLGSTEWITFPPSAQVNADYLKFFLMRENVRRYLTENVSGVGGSLMRVNTEVVGKIEMPVAPASEQLRIAAAVNTLFEELDEAEAALARAREGVEQFRASLLHAACTGQLTASWREMNPSTQTGADLLRRILAKRRTAWERSERARLEAKGTLPRGDAWKARYVEPTAPDLTDMPDLPEGWTWATVEQLAFVSGGLTKNVTREKFDMQAPYLRVANVGEGKIDLTDLRSIGIEPSELPRLLLKTGDVLFVEGNGSADQIGRVAIWEGTVSPCVHQNHLIKARPVLHELGSLLLSWFMSPLGKRFIQDAASSTSGLHTLSIGKISVLPCPLPNLSELAAISETLGTNLAVELDTRSQLLGLKTDIKSLRQSVLHAAFTGCLVQQDPADEPASALLARLRNTASPSRRARGRNATKVPA